MVFVYIDESGDLGTSKKSSNYFIITALIISNPKQCKRLIKNMRRHKFKKILKNVSELKANNSNTEIREHIITQFSKMNNATAHCLVLEKKKLYSSFLKNEKHKLYNFVCGSLTKAINYNNDSEIIIRIDKSKGKQTLRDDFDKYISQKSVLQFWNKKTTIYHSYSHAWEGLQIVDFISWAIFLRFEHNNNFFFKIIENKTKVDFVWEEKSRTHEY